MTYLCSMLFSCACSCAMTYLFLPLHAMQLCDNILSALEGGREGQILQLRPKRVVQMSSEHARALTLVLQATLHFLYALQQNTMFSNIFLCALGSTAVLAAVGYCTCFSCSMPCSCSRSCAMTYLCSMSCSYM